MQRFKSLCMGGRWLQGAGQGTAHTSPDKASIAEPKTPPRQPSRSPRPSRSPAGACPSHKASAREPVTGLGMQVTCGINTLAGADSAPGLGALFEVFGVPSDMCLHELADQVLLHTKSHNRLQLGITLLQLLVASLDGRGDTRNLLSLFGTITPFGKGTQSQGTKGRQRDLLPLPLPAFGALPDLVKKLKRSAAGIIIWDPAEARKICKQQLKRSVDAACHQTWRLLCVLVLNGESSSW